MKKHLCIGGPLNGMEADYVEATNIGYTAYNCSGGAHRTQFAKKRAIARGEVIIPSMIWVHDSCLKSIGFPSKERSNE